MSLAPPDLERGYLSVSDDSRRLDNSSHSSIPLAMKRRRENSPSTEAGPSTQKRSRQPTPIDEGSTQSLSFGIPDEDESVSASLGAYIPGPIGDAGPSHMEHRGTQSDMRVTSETDASILFSDQHMAGETSNTNGRGDSGPAHAPDDSVVQARDDGEDDEDVKVEDENAQDGQDDGNESEFLDESQDQNDVAHDVDEEDKNETPEWLVDDKATNTSNQAGPSRPRTARTATTTEKVAEGDEDADVESPDPLEMSPEQCEEENDEAEEDNVEEGSEYSQGSYHSGDSDQFEMDYRPILERTAVKKDCLSLQETLWPMYDAQTGKLLYQVTDRLGEGTFSSVYMARDKLHTRFDNQYWTGVEPEPSDSEDPDEDGSIRVALKKILVTSSPSRIENELSILESLRGCRNVSQLVTAFRAEDQIVIVLPFHRSDDFRHYYRHIDISHMKAYMGCLLRSLSDIHSRGIVHRDVKPANFLFDYENSSGVLCDFGLAERYAPPRKPTCQHSPATLSSLGGGKTRTGDTPAVEQAVYDARKRAKLGDGRIGFLSDDKRPTIKTNRAGTRGFRAPEVLLKCPDQSFAIDVWSAGIILLSILTQKFPVFNSNDDIEALMELAALFGRSALERCAMLHNRTVISNVPSLDAEPHRSLTDICLKLNPYLYTPPQRNPTRAEAKKHIKGIDNALDLLHGLLRMDSTSRYTAARALRHEFLKPEPDQDDSAWAELDAEASGVLSVDEGKCGYLHGMLNGKHKLSVWNEITGDEVQDMHFGQGQPTSTEALCPEHEHWQQRTGRNPLVACKPFSQLGLSPPRVQPTKTDDLHFKRPPLADRDENIVQPKPTHFTKLKSTPMENPFL